MRDFIDVDIWSEQEAVLRNPGYVQELARFYKFLSLSAEGCLNWLILELCHYNHGDFFDYDGLYIDLETENIADAFGVDTRRTMNVFLGSASHKPGHLVQRRNLRRMMWLCLARKSYEARLRSN